MALLETYGSENLVRNQLPSTRYVRTPFNALVSELVGTVYLNVLRRFYIVEAIKTESFSYVGMSESAAAACQSEMETLWVKPITLLSLENGLLTVGQPVDQCVADIRSTPMGGLMWRVDVDVTWPVYTIEQAVAHV